MRRFLFCILLSGLLASAKTVGPAKEIGTSGWTLTTDNFKNVKVNGSPLKKGLVWEFNSISQVETEKTTVLIFLADQYYLKLFPNTLMRWMDSSTLQLVKGRIYVKSLSGDMTFQIPIFFKFKVAPGDFIAEYDTGLKMGSFEIIGKDQVIQIDSDDRELTTLPGTKLSFQPEYVDGELAFDFLLNDRKIPKLKMEKVKTSEAVIDISQWKKVVKKAAGDIKKVAAKAKADSSKYICKQPNGMLNTCFFIKEGSNCIRYTCNLNGAWSLKTTFAKNDLCPAVKTVKDCEWLGR